MSSDRKAKLIKLDGFRRSLPHVSASALSAILAEVSKTGTPEVHSRSSFRDASRLLTTRSTPYGPLLTSMLLHCPDGNTQQIPCVNPLAYLYTVFSQGGSMQQTLQTCFEKHKPSADAPWRLIFYTDEVVPGNPLGHENKRKTWVLYFSFMELGVVRLQQEENWFLGFACRSGIVNGISAGISQALAAYVKMFFKTLGHNASDGGFVLNRPEGGLLRLFMKPGMILQDGGAHKQVFHCKGDAGTKLCMLCVNLVAKRSAVLRSDLLEEDAGLVANLFLDSELVFATDASIRESLQRLVAAKAAMSQSDFNLFQQAVGFNYEEFGLLFDEDLRHLIFPVSVFCHDWMHLFFVNGVWNTTAQCFLACLSEKVPDTHRVLCDYVQTWSLPSSCSVRLKDLFQKKRMEANRKAQSFRCTASEGLTVYPLIAVLIQSVLQPAAHSPEACEAYLALCDVLDMLQATHAEVVLPPDLKRVCVHFLQSVVRSGWEEHMHPKFHWIVHLHQHLAKFGMLPTCWTHERKHKLIKRYANDAHNTSTYETTILSEVVCHDLAAHKSEGRASIDSCCLIGAKPMSERVHQLCLQSGLVSVGLKDTFLMSSKAKLQPAGLCSKNDVVLIRLTSSMIAGRVLFHLDIDGFAVSLIKPFKLQSYDRAKSVAIWIDRDPECFVRTQDVVCTLVSSPLANAVKTLVPFQHRNAI